MYGSKNVPKLTLKSYLIFIKLKYRNIRFKKKKYKYSLKKLKISFQYSLRTIIKYAKYLLLYYYILLNKNMFLHAKESSTKYKNLI